MKKFLKFIFLYLIFLGKSSQIKSGEIDKSNILKNSSFSVTTVSGIPDYWNCARVAEWREDWPQCWVLTDESFIPNTRSVKLINPKPFYGGERNILRSICYPIDAKKDYTLSVYLKSDRPETEIEISLISWEGVPIISQKVRVKEKWERYIFTGRFNGKGSSIVQAYVMFIFSDKGTVWINCPQLEEGKVATQYVPDIIKDDIYKNFSSVGEREPLRIKCKLINNPPLIDGSLNDECWKKSTKIGDFSIFGTDELAKNQTEVYICRSSDTIFIGFRCFEPSPESIKAKTQKRDSSEIFQDDELEIFISSKEEGVPYYHLVFNALGVQYDAQIQDVRWNGDWRVETSSEEKAWTAEVAIRLYNFSFQEKPKQTWRINFGRHRSSQNSDEWSSWQPMFVSFHTPEKFGYLELEGDDLRDFFVNVVPDIKVLPDSVLKPDFEILGLPWGEKEEFFQANFLIYEGNNLKEKVTKTGKIKPGERILVDELSTLGKDREDNVIFYQLFLPERKKLVQKNMVSNLKKLTKKTKGISLAFDRSYYTDEEKMIVLAHLSPIMRNYNLEMKIVSGENGIIFSKRKWASPLPEEIEWELKLPKLNKDTIYKLEARILSNKGEEILSERKEVIHFKNPPSSGTKIDHIKRMCLIDGKHSIIFSIGMDDWSRKVPSDKVRPFKDVAEHGFNTITYFFPGELDFDDVQWILDTCQKLGLKIILSPNFPSMSYKELKEKYLKLVSIFKGHPTLLGWIICDEPGPNGTWEKYSGKEELLIDLANSVKQIDPYHPIFCSYCGLWSSDMYGGLEINDIYHMNKYPFGKVREPLQTMIALAKDMAVDGLRDYKPTSLFLQLYSFFDSPRMPTAQEQYCQTYLMLIHKVRLFHYYLYKPMSVEIWESMKLLAEEMKFMSSIVSGDEIENWGNCSVKEVHSTLFKKGNKKFLIAVNASGKPQKVEFQFSNNSIWHMKKRKVNVLFEKRVLYGDKNNFVDKFGPYERHIYEWD